MVDEAANDEGQLSAVLKVTSNITRRRILTALAQEGPTRVTDLAKRYAMSLNAVSKHIKALESAGLVSRKKIGREHLIAANLEPVKFIDQWFQQLRSIWEIRLEKLDQILEEDAKVEELSLHITRTVKAPIETVYRAWLDPALLAQFMLAGDGMTVPKAKTDPVEGGRFTIIMAAGDQELPHGGEYLQLQPYSRIQFTWESPFSVDGSTVTLNFNKTAEGTEIDLVHVKFIDEDAQVSHKAGWDRILEQLESVLS